MCVEDACNTPQEMVPLVTCLYATAVVSTCSEYGVPDKRLTAQLIESCRKLMVGVHGQEL